MPDTRVLVSLALLVAGAGMVLAAGAHRPVTASPVDKNYPVNTGALDPGDLSAHNSPVIARNPTDPANVVIANRIDSPTYSCALHVSTDSTETFSSSAIPVPRGERAKCYAPDVAFGADGTLYIVFVTLEGRGNVPNAVWLSSSSDGGRTLSDPTKVLGPLSFQVRVTTDPQAADRLYLTWLEAAEVGIYSFTEGGNPIQMSVSDDGGSTWSDPVQVNDPDRLRVIAPSPVVAPDGSITVVYVDLRDDHLDYHGAHGGRGGPPYPGTWSLVMARSTDGGTTWSETVIDQIVPTERFIVFIPPYPSVAAHPDDGSIFVSFHDGRAGDSDVWLWSSHDGGTTFSDPVRVNDTRQGDRTSQYLPALGTAPSGRVDVLYFDRREDPNNVLNEVSLQYSTDGGRTFSSRLRVSDRAFDSRIGFGSEAGMSPFGSRLGLLSTETEALAVWTDTRSGTTASAKQDLARAVVRFSPPSPLSASLSGLLRSGGWTLIVVGGGVLARSMQARRLARNERSEDADATEGSVAPGEASPAEGVRSF